MFNKLKLWKENADEKKRREAAIVRVTDLTNKVLKVLSDEKANFYEIFDVLINVQGNFYPQVGNLLRTNHLQIQRQLKEINDLKTQIYVNSESEEDSDKKDSE